MQVARARRGTPHGLGLVPRGRSQSCQEVSNMGEACGTVRSYSPCLPPEPLVSLSRLAGSRVTGSADHRLLRCQKRHRIDGNAVSDVGPNQQSTARARACSAATRKRPRQCTAIEGRFHNMGDDRPKRHIRTQPKSVPGQPGIHQHHTPLARPRHQRSPLRSPAPRDCVDGRASPPPQPKAAWR